MKKILTICALALSLCSGPATAAEYDLEPHYWGKVGYFAPFDYYVVAVDVAPNGNVHLVDLFHDRISIHEPGGALVSQFPIADLWPRGIATDAAGNSYVADANGSTKIRKYSPTGQILQAFGTEGSAPGEFDYPRALQVNSEGLLIVADNATELTAFDADGNLVWNNMDTVVPAGLLGQPQGLAIDADDNIYVVDTETRKVVVFDPEGAYLRDWGPSGPGWQIRTPVSVTIGNNGNIYVLQRLQNNSTIGDDLIQVFDPQGQFVTSFGVKGREAFNLWEPQGISTGTDGSIWVAGFQGHNVVRYDQDGNGIDEWNDHNPTPYEFAQARGASIGVDGRLYAIDFWNHLVQVFDRYGNFEEMWGERGQGDGQLFNFPKHTTTDDEGNLYVSDDGWIRKFAPDGQFLERFTPGVSSYPGGLEVDNAGNLWVSVSGQAKVVRYNPSLQMDLSLPSDSFPGGLRWPQNIRQAPNGLIYLADSLNHRIVRMDQSGNFDLTWGTLGSDPGQFRSPVGMAIDSENRIYVSETWSERMQVFSADGSYLTGWDLPGVPGKLPSRVLELALDGDYFLYAPDHTFGQAEIHKYALVPQADVAGEPVLPGGQLAATLWSDDNRLWHLRWEADGVNREFTGKIHSTSGIEHAYAAAGVPVTASIAQVSDEMAIFSAVHSADVAGVDILVSGPGIVTFEFEVDDESRPDILRVGAQEFVPNSLPLPFETVGGLTNIDPLGMPNYTPAVDAGFFLWRDETDGDWLLWWSGDSVVNRNFSGSVVSTEGILAVTPLNFEPEDSLIETTGEFSFDGIAGAGQDGVRFSVPDGSTITLDLRIDEAIDLEKVSVGSAGENPTEMPFSMISLPVGSPLDTDGDSVADWQDNCTEVSNPSQCDSDQDGYGNACDADLDNSGLVNFLDLSMLKASFLTSEGDPQFNPDADSNCDQTINFVDLSAFRDQMLTAPGPSGLVP